MQDLRSSEAIKKPSGGVTAPQASQLDTNLTRNSNPPLAGLTNLIQEAQRRAENRRKSSDKRKRQMALMTYHYQRDFEEFRETYGLNLDRQV